MRDTRAETNEGPRRRAERGTVFINVTRIVIKIAGLEKLWTNRNEFVILVSSHETGSAWRGFIQWIGSRRWRGESEFRGSVNSNTREWYAPHKIPYRSLGPAWLKRARNEQGRKVLLTMLWSNITRSYVWKCCFIMQRRERNVRSIPDHICRSLIEISYASNWC